MSALQHADSRNLLVRRPLYALLYSLLYCGVAEAGARFVTSCADDNSAGTLRHQAAALNGLNVLDLSALTCNPVTLTQGPLTYSDSLDIVGPTDRSISIVGNGNDRVFLRVASPGQHGSLQLENITVSGGRVDSSTNFNEGGGCILTTGALVLINSTVTDCRVSLGRGVIKGGAIYAVGYITLRKSVVSDSGISAQKFYAGSGGGGAWTASQVHCVDSSFRDNTMTGPGVSAGGGFYAADSTLDRCSIEGNAPGGVLVVSAAASTLTNSTIAQNSGGDGLQFAGSGSVSISSSTISGNSGGFGIDAPSQSVSLISSTIVGNTGNGTSGGGLYSARNVNAQSSIFANNAPYDLYVFRSDLSGADNLVVSTNATDPLSGSSVDPGAIVCSANPRLAPLGYHGGTTRVHALLPNSPAINLGNNNTAFTSDQRGAPRESPAGKPDIGAYERQPGDDELFYNGFDPSS
jgi:Right handed beta helix region